MWQPIMIKKNSLLGYFLTHKEQKHVTGGLPLCGTYRRKCTYAFTNEAACADWAWSQWADDYTFNPSTCYCCALIENYPCSGMIP
jgi:hypothetical protein